MAEIIFAVPVLPDKEELDRSTLDEMTEARRDEYESALREAGITRHAVWHEDTPEGTLALVYMQADDADAPMRFTNSDGAINKFFVQRMQEVHGIDISQTPPPPVTKVHDVEI